MSEELDSGSFNKNYKVLKDTAKWLSDQKEPDIDQLVPKVETAMKAYSICKDRLDKVQATLGQYFQKDAALEEVGESKNGDDSERKSSGPNMPEEWRRRWNPVLTRKEFPAALKFKVNDRSSQPLYS